MSVYDNYEMTIGIESHVQLATKTKLFSPADNDARDAKPNSKIHSIDFALPGMLPILNREAINLAVKAAKALNAPVAKISRFDRKHYFYPDLPKGYQTTQMYHPTIGAGFVDAPLAGGGSVRVRIHHAHIEEDAGKLTHFGDYSLVDLNRAGTPLIEVVSEPDIHSAEEARAFASELHKLMVYAGVTHGDLYHGNMRFDVNISVAKKGSEKLGTRAEVKNLNSFRSVERAAEYEFKRQVDLLEAGEKVVQETRGWNEDKQITISQRSKEDAQDYRYMPDADIPPIVLGDEEIAKIQSEIGKLPSDYRDGWQNLQLDSSVVETILSHEPIAKMVDFIKVDLLDGSAKNFNLKSEKSKHESIVKRIFNLFASTPVDEINVEYLTLQKVRASDIVILSDMAEAGDISSSSAKELFVEVFKDENLGVDVAELAEKKGLIQNSNLSEIEAIVDEVLADPNSEKSINDIMAGKEKAIGYLVGQVMKKSKGQANPAMANQMIKDRLVKGDDK